MPADTLVTLLAATSVASLGALSIVVLPWRSEEFTDSWLAWLVLVDRVRAAFGRVREIRSVAPARAVRSIG